MPGVDRRSRGVKGGPVRLKLELLDFNNEPIFTWYPTSTNIALGLRKAAEVAAEKLGVDLSKEGIVLVKHKKAEEPSSSFWALMGGRTNGR